MVKLKLFKSYCTSIYGAELSALDSANIETFVLHGVKLSGVYYNHHTTPIPTFFLV